MKKKLLNIIGGIFPIILTIVLFGKMEEIKYSRIAARYVESENYKEALEYLHIAVEHKEVGAYELLGLCYELGKGVEPNYEEAVKWLKKAAPYERCSQYAPYLLGWCYMYGKGIEQNYEKAFQWFRNGARKGDSQAQFYYGMCWSNGYGVEKSDAMAVKWYKKAVKQGHIQAMYNLGCCYLGGQGVKQDTLKAVELFRKAAYQGSRGAVQALKSLRVF